MDFPASPTYGRKILLHLCAELLGQLLAVRVNLHGVALSVFPGTYARAGEAAASCLVGGGAVT
jgi:hypothetical protein